MSPKFHLFEKWIPQSCSSYFCPNNAFANELFTYVLYYHYFALTSIENQQYLNLKK